MPVQHDTRTPWLPPHAATGDGRARLWARWREIDKQLDAYAARRSRETAVVVLAPRNDASGAVAG